jgi:HD-GYP domain-containing protein (c-di-GMP phosphodiesterase class II)
MLASQESLAPPRSLPLSNGGADTHVRVDVRSLVPGVRLHQPIRDEAEKLLLASGLILTEALLEKLAERGIASVRVHKSELARLTSGAPRKSPARDLGWTDAPASVTTRSTFSRPDHTPLHSPSVPSRSEAPPLFVRPTGTVQRVVPLVANLGSIKCSGKLLAKLERHGVAPHSPERVEAASRNYQATLRGVVGLYESGKEIRSGELSTLQGIGEECLAHMLTDIDVFVRQSGIPEVDKYPPRHGQQTAMLAMSMGINLGLEKGDLIDLGTACLVHDLGMLHLREDVYNHPERLTRLSRLEISKHPGITFDLLSNVERTAGTARLVAYQMHERCNGSGYPRGRTDGQIHPLAKIAAVADSYLAMISPRPYRPAMTPYQAIEQLLVAARDRLYDPLAVRALLRSVSLFPIGSQVELSDGRSARVLRTCGDNYTKPVVEIWTPGLDSALAEIVDLNEPSRPSVIRALAG